jgi:hypothetical protein
MISRTIDLTCAVTTDAQAILAARLGGLHLSCPCSSRHATRCPPCMRGTRSHVTVLLLAGAHFVHKPAASVSAPPPYHPYPHPHLHPTTPSLLPRSLSARLACAMLAGAHAAAGLASVGARMRMHVHLRACGWPGSPPQPPWPPCAAPAWASAWLLVAAGFGCGPFEKGLHSLCGAQLFAGARARLLHGPTLPTPLHAQAPPALSHEGPVAQQHAVRAAELLLLLLPGVLLPLLGALHLPGLGLLAEWWRRLCLVEGCAFVAALLLLTCLTNPGCVGLARRGLAWARRLVGWPVVVVPFSAAPMQMDLSHLLGPTARMAAMGTAAASSLGPDSSSGGAAAARSLSPRAAGLWPVPVLPPTAAAQLPSGSCLYRPSVESEVATMCAQVTTCALGRCWAWPWVGFGGTACTGGLPGSMHACSMLGTWGPLERALADA